MTIQLLNMDCLEYMTEQPDNSFDLAIVDPPYGIGVDGQKGVNKGKKSDRKRHCFKGWDKKIPDKQYFSELFRVSKKQIIWGGELLC